MSGVSENAVDPWLGRLPAGWSIKRLGALGALVKGRGGSKEDNRDAGVPVVRYGDLYTKFDTTIAAPVAFVSEEDAARYTPLPMHSIVFAASGESAEDIGKSAMSLLAEPAVVGGDAVVFHPSHEIDPLYLAYALESSPLRAYKAIRSTGFTVVHISAGKLKTLPIPIPPLAKQRAIAHYLDRETVRIDTLIEEQQRLIEMLRERRQAVAMHAILQSTGSATDKLGRTARIGNGSTPRRDSAIYWRGGHIPWLNSSVVNKARVSGAEQFVTAVALRECHLPVVAPGSVLVGLTGQGKTRGMATILDIEATVNQHVAYVTPDRSRWLPEYLLWSLRASYDELRRLSEENGSTKGGLTCEALKQFRLAVPPLDEQRRIAAYLDGQTAKIDTLIVETEGFIELARERRAALITAAVTGQIDVREAA
ncbi:restriction endonuclease subunit S [Amycolatopsis thermophila]|uniref:Type I restriction enzyme S subunit n=1 Tax=Amycolatopsis thermophila TaxID=206084 RepID=A0ABU0EN92_9PSEU|nr:restriction endonuclease subunit S [Amycolatopsis thermophila]MDQ0376282.1 type I restriction enzyme S subunit [Amycolatopsis thermophila]